MAKEGKTFESEEMENNYNFNKYTIRYDSKSKRFFKGFAPKIASGGVISTAVFAGLGVATLVTGGLAGIGIATIAGASVGAGALAQTIYSGVVYNRNSAKSRFKHLGIEDNEDKANAIDIILDCDNQAYKYRQILESQPNEKRPFVDGNRVSRRLLRKVIKEQEEVAYHGLKYILNEAQKASKKSEYDTLDIVSECVKELASKRDDFNPYKNLIVSYILKGCMLGENDAQNKKIALIREKKDKNQAFELYHLMYEQSHKDKFKRHKEPTTLTEDKDETLEELEATKRKLAAANSALEREKKLHTNSTKRAVDKRAKLREMTAGRDAEKARADQNELMHDRAREEASRLVRENGELQLQHGATKTSLTQTQAKLKREEKMHARATRTALAKRAQLREATASRDAEIARANELESKLTISDTELMEMSASRDAERAKAAKGKGKSKTAGNLIARLIQENNKLQTENEKSKVSLEYAGLFLDGAYDEIDKLNSDIVAKDAQLREMTASRDAERARAEQSERKHKRATKLVGKRTRENESLQTINQENEVILAQTAVENERLQTTLEYAGMFLDIERDEVEKLSLNIAARDAELRKMTTRAEKTESDLYDAMAVLYESKQNEQIAYNSAKQLETQLQSSERRRKNVLKREKKAVDKNKELTIQIDALTAERDALIEGQNANIATIMDLETDIRVATEQRDKVKSKNKKLEQKLVDTGYELHKTRNQKAEIERDRDAYKAQTEDLMYKNARLEDENQQLQDVADELLAEKQTKQYNFMRGSAMRRLNNLLAKIDAHIEYTKEENENYDEDKETKQAIDYLHYCITTLRTKSPTSMTLLDISDAQKVLKVTYEAQRRNLAKISDKKLRELAKEQNSIIIDDKGLKR